MNTKLKLNLGISISLPVTDVNKDFVIPEYSTEPADSSELVDIEYNHNKTKSKSKLNSLQIMFTKQTLAAKEISNIKDIIKKLKFKYIYVHAASNKYRYRATHISH